MKGFSFKGLVDLAQEAWNLATASVKKAGDTMTGELVLNVPSSANPLRVQSDSHVYISGHVADGSRCWYMGKGSSESDEVTLKNDLTGTSVTLRTSDILFNKSPRATAAQGGDADSLTRKDYVDSALAGKSPVGHVHTADELGIDDLLHTVLERPAGAVAGTWYPVLCLPQPKLGAEISISSRGSGGADPMNNSSFRGIIRGGGWTDMHDSVSGHFSQYGTNERSISLVVAGAEDSMSIAFYVHEAAFPVEIRHRREEMAAPTTGTTLYHGLSVFTGTTDPNSVPGNTKTRIAINFNSGDGIYDNAAGKVYGTIQNPPASSIVGLYDAIYPIGSCIIRIDNTTPNQLGFPGSWGKFSADYSIHTAAADGSNVGQGVGTHFPGVPVTQHNHSFTTNPAGNHTHTADDNQAGEHSHTVNTRTRSDYNTGHVQGARGGGSSEHHTDTDWYPTTSASGGHNHNITVQAVGDHQHIGATDAAGTAGATIDVRGARILVNIWVRQG